MNIMNDPFQMQRELRYGAPVCDQILTGRHFTIGYSWYFRQAKWTLEIINRDRELVEDLDAVERLNNFRADTRIPKRFRAGLRAYKGSGFDRGHLVASANQDLQNIQNSETFLLSNMSPQIDKFNRGIWRKLETEIRELDKKESTLETYVLTCPVFLFGEPIERIG
jgi:endonuclease G